MNPYGSGGYVGHRPDAGTTVIPPLLRRCPECGHRGPSRRFAVVRTDGGRRLVECPVCGHRFAPVEDPRLN